MVEKGEVLLIDASIYIFRYYFSMPDNWFCEEKNWPTAAVYGYTTFLFKLLGLEQPTHIAACFDESLTSCFRNEIYPDYKSNRTLPDEALAFQLRACREVTELLGIQSYSSKVYEADDLLASLYQQLKSNPQPIAILTRDKDLGQVLRRDQDFLWDYLDKGAPANNYRQGSLFYGRDIIHKFGVKPHQLVDYLALKGDSIDNIPGVPGVGKRTAQSLLNHMGSVDNIFEQLETVGTLPIRGASKLIDKLEEYQDQINMAKSLASVVGNIPLIEGHNDIRWMKPSWDQLLGFFQSMGFPGLTKSMLKLQQLSNRW